MRNSKAKGFTLIELIVVMAIIGVLAAILVPSMIGYLNDSKYSKANANAKQVYQSAANWCTKCETNNHPAKDVSVDDAWLTPDKTTASGTGDDGKPINADLTFNAGTDGTDSEDLYRALYVYMGGNPNSGYAATTIKNSAPKFAQWAGSDAETGDEGIFGEYPNELNANKRGDATWGSQTELN